MIRKIARPMLASVYIADGVDTLTNPQAHVDSTESVLKKVNAVVPRQYAALIPNDPALVARAVGGTKVGAGSLLALGKAPRLSAGVLALTAIPTIIGRHAFWETSDPKEKSARRSGFLTNVALLGGLSITAMDTAGKPGLRWRTSHAAHDAAKTIQSALPGKSDTESALDSAGEWISERTSQAQEAAKLATDNIGSYVDDNKDDWKKQAAVAAATAGTLLGQAREQGKSVAQDVQKKAPKWAEQAIDQSSHLLSRAEKQRRHWLDDAQKDAKKARKRVVKAADKAQSRAEDARDTADRKTGRALKKASKKASKLQGLADKKINKAKKKIG